MRRCAYCGAAKRPGQDWYQVIAPGGAYAEFCETWCLEQHLVRLGRQVMAESAPTEKVARPR